MDINNPNHTLVTMGFIALASAVGASIPLIFNHMMFKTPSTHLTSIVKPNQCPFPSHIQSTPTSTPSLPQDELIPSTGCPYLASKDQPVPPIDMTHFPLYRATSTPSPPLLTSPSRDSSSQHIPYTAQPHDITAARPVPRKSKEPIHYHTYLHLDPILSAQKPLSWTADGTNSHDEHLFIIVHQASEIWFKQIIHDLLSIIAIFNSDYVSESHMATVIERLQRISKIQLLLIDHLKVLASTMSPLSFLDFRDNLFPASGFQSVQMRQIECLLGLKRESRLTYAGSEYDSVLLPEQQEKMKILETTVPSLFTLVDKWLSRTPILSTTSTCVTPSSSPCSIATVAHETDIDSVDEHCEHRHAETSSSLQSTPAISTTHSISTVITTTYSFWVEYHNAVLRSLDEQKKYVETMREEKSISEGRYRAELNTLKQQRIFFENFFDEEKYNENILNAATKSDKDSTLAGGTQLTHNIFSYQSIQAILMINFYREVPIFQAPFSLLALLQEIDENFQSWRSTHAQMVFKMLGTKMGTGGSSGHAYLSETVHKHRIFHQLSAVSSLLVPRNYLNPLPEHVFNKCTFFPSEEPGMIIEYAHASNYDYNKINEQHLNETGNGEVYYDIFAPK